LRRGCESPPLRNRRALRLGVLRREQDGWFFLLGRVLVEDDHVDDRRALSPGGASSKRPPRVPVPRVGGAASGYPGAASPGRPGHLESEGRSQHARRRLQSHRRLRRRLPRFNLGVDTTGDGVSDGSVRIAFGPSPSFTDCAAGWQTTGNLIGNSDAGRYDYSAFGGSPFTTYANAPASVQNGQVVRASIAVDASWSADATGGDGEQTVLVDNVDVNGHVTTFDAVTPTSADACKNGGWQNL
jgi:hypothetical protein